MIPCAVRRQGGGHATAPPSGRIEPFEIGMVGCSAGDRPASETPRQREGAGRGLLSFLLGDGPAPCSEFLREIGIGAYAYATRVDIPDRLGLRRDFLASSARHQATKNEIVPLLREWHRRGIDSLLFKGFYLSEFVYPVRGTRWYGDVDILVPPEQENRARESARDLGWSEETVTEEEGYGFNHMVCSLYGPGGSTLIDLHRFILHCRVPWNGVQRRVTRAVWERARKVAWEGTQIHLPDPIDALLAGLILQRAWGDRWGTKVHDPLDFLLLEKEGASRPALEARARELRCSRTLEIFLERCHPSRGRFELGALTPKVAGRLDRRVVFERWPLGPLETFIRRLPQLRHLPEAVTRGVAALVRARRAVGRLQPMEDLLRALTPPDPPARSSRLRRFRTIHGVRLFGRLNPWRRRGDCLIRSLALYSELRRQGWPVTFVSGIRRGEGGVTGHAWVEFEGRVLPELYEPENRKLYAVNFVYPPTPAERSFKEVAGSFPGPAA